MDGALWLHYTDDELSQCGSRLLRLDPTDGDILSSEETNGRGPIVAAGPVVAHRAIADCDTPEWRHQLVVRDLENRDPLWSYTFPAGVTGVETPTIAHGYVFVIAGRPWNPTDMALYAFDADGCGAGVCEPVWVQEDIEGLQPLHRPVAGPNGTLFVIDRRPDEDVNRLGVTAVDAATGDVQWQTEPRFSTSLPGGLAGLAVGDDTLYVTGYIDENNSGRIDEGVLDAYPASGCGRSECAPDWHMSFGEDVRPATPPTVGGGVVYVGRTASNVADPAVVATDAAGCGEPTCDPVASVTLAETSLPGDPYQISVAGGRVFIGWRYPNLDWLPNSALFSLGPEES